MASTINSTMPAMVTTSRGSNRLRAIWIDLLSATLSACRQRLRPILMTSLAFIFGVLPMATSTGAGSGSQHAVGTGVMGGMINLLIVRPYRHPALPPKEELFRFPPLLQHCLCIFPALQVKIRHEYLI